MRRNNEIDAIDSSAVSNNPRVDGCSALIMYLPRLRGATCMTLGGTDKKGGSWDRLSWHHAATFQCNHRRFAPYAAAVFSLIVYFHLEIVNFCPSNSGIGARYVLSFSMSFACSPCRVSYLLICKRLTFFVLSPYNRFIRFTCQLKDSLLRSRPSISFF